MTWSYVGVAVWVIAGFWLGKTDYRLALLVLALSLVQWVNFDRLERSVAALERRFDMERIWTGSDNTVVGNPAGVGVEMWSKDVVTRLPKDAAGLLGRGEPKFHE
jgi:hypothetical protein